MKKLLEAFIKSNQGNKKAKYHLELADYMIKDINSNEHSYIWVMHFGGLLFVLKAIGMSTEQILDYIKPVVEKSTGIY